MENNLVFTNPVTASAFRIYNSVDGVIRIRELALYPPNGVNGYPIGTDLTLNLAQQRPTIASSNTSGNFAMMAVDGRAHKDSKWQTTAVGANSLEIDLRVSTKIGSAHLYSGSIGVTPLADFVLRYWDGLAWQDIPGGTVTGNTSADLVVPFTGGVTTSKVRLEFTNPGTTSVRELCIFPANDLNLGYPLGTGVIGATSSAAKLDIYNDAFYAITNPAANRPMTVSNGTPGLSQNGQSIEQGQYQVLLNLSTGTYRLRNRATGYCLSGARLSTTPGELLIDSPYSALPDQDWILNSINGTTYQWINQWSGLAIDTQGGGTAPGTPLVQNVNTHSAGQSWQMVLSTHSPKKGVGGGNYAAAFNAKWMYNWGLTNVASLPAGALHHPMQWSGNTTTGSSLWKLYSTWRGTGASPYLLGFNEPDHTDQANMSAALALELWPRLEAMDMPLVAPVPADTESVWMDDFMNGAIALGYRIDAIANHNYASPNGGSSNSIISRLQNLYTTWGRPVWMTEFSFVDWSGTSSWTEEDNYNCLAEFMWRAESLPWLRKYALFVFTEDANNPQPDNPWSTSVSTGGAPRSNARDANGGLTPFGELYAAWDGDATIKTGKSYHIHSKITRKRLANSLASTADAKSIRTNDNSVQWTLAQSPTPNRYYLISSRDGRRLSYINAGSVNLVAAATTGTAVEWGLTESQYGWFYIEHPATAKRLKLAYNNTTGTPTFSMVANSTTGDTILWRFIVTTPKDAWKGASGTSWTVGGNWTSAVIPPTGGGVMFNSSSTANLTTVLNQDFNLWGVTVTTPTGPVSIGGVHSLTVGGGGIDLSGTSQNLTISSPLVLGSLQNWHVASGRTLSVTGGVSGSFPFTVAGPGTVSLGAAATHSGDTTVMGTLKTDATNVLPYGSAAGDLILNGTLDLNGTSQLVNGLNGGGIVDNTATGGLASLTVGMDGTTSIFNGTIQNTSGTVALLKTGTGNLTLTGPNTYSGGTANNGTGGIFPKSDNTFGSGPVVMNAGTLYATGGVYNFANSLALNGATLRVGGGAGRSINWSGPVSVTGNSGLSADGSTSGITLSGGLDMNNGGHTLTSYASGTANTISAPISGGSGTIMVTFGTLNLNAANTFGGTFRSSVGGPLKIGDPLAMQNATLDMNAADAGSVSLSNLSATLGSLTGSRNLGLGSGTVSIGNNHLSTTYSGILSGSGGSLVKTGVGKLTLSGANSYTGTTSVNAGTLALGASNALPNTAIALGNATLDAATFTDTVGALAVTGPAKINLGTGAALAFANSSAAGWAGGNLNLTGTFVPGVSLRFGTTSSGLTSTQLALISAPGFMSFSLNSTGYLTATVAGSYSAWKTANSTAQAINLDHDNDGVSNGIEYFLFGSANTTGFTALPGVTNIGGTRSLTWTKAASYTGTYGTHFVVETSSTLSAWTPAVLGTGADKVEITGNNVKYTFPSSGSKNFARLKVTGP